MSLIFAPVPLPRPVCWDFKKRGTCDYGASCRFSHDALDFVCRSGQHSFAPPDSAAAESAELPMMYILHKMPQDATEYALLVGTLQAHGFNVAATALEEKAARLLWCGTATLPATYPICGSPISADCVVNRVGCGSCITHKDRLSLSLSNGKQTCLAPRTYRLPDEREALEAAAADGVSNQLTWIVKPVSAGKGRGIFVTKDTAEISLDRTCVVCDYIDNPLLVDGHKVDLRLYVLVLQTMDGQGRAQRRAYLSRNGYARFALKMFSMVDIGGKGNMKQMGAATESKAADCAARKMSAPRRGVDPCEIRVNGQFDPFVHLTYINSIDQLLHREQRAKEWTVKQLLDWIAAQGAHGKYASEQFWSAIKQLSLRTINCLPPPTSTGSTAFELFGFDVLPDANLRPWLLEVNGQPHLGSTSKKGSGQVFVAEHEAKGTTIAAALTIAMAAAEGVHDAQRLDELACNGGFDLLFEEPSIGEQWWPAADGKTNQPE